MRVGIDLKLFELLAEHDHAVSLTVEEVAAKTSADSELLGMELPSFFLFYFKRRFIVGLKSGFQRVESPEDDAESNGFQVGF